jgi:hypothetical protein
LARTAATQPLAPLMLAGHCGAGLAIKARYPKVPLIAILLAAELPDLLWVLFQTLGWETLRAAPMHPLRPDTLGPMPFSHDVSMTLIYATILGAVGMLTASMEWSVALAGAVGSHLLLDVLVHAPDIGVAGPWLRFEIGLDLWRRSPYAAWGLEMLVILVGGGLYVRARQPRTPGAWRAWAAVGLLVVVQFAALAVW